MNACPTISQAENCLSSSTSQDIPLLSIIVPNYNHARFLPERFASIRRQTFTDYELIVLDDASTDDSVEVIRKELTGIPHQLISNEQNSGSPCSQWIKGLKQARGTYVWIAESDDSCSPDFLATLVDLMEQGATLAYCRSKAVDEQNHVIPDASYWPDSFDQCLWHECFSMRSKEFCQHHLVNANVIPNASAVVFIRAQANTCVSMATSFESLVFTGDWLFWLEYLASDDGVVSYSCIEDSFFRHHQESTRSESGSKEREALHIREYCQMIAYLSRHAMTKEQSKWHIRAKNSGWDWMYAEYLHRCKPSRRQVLTASGLHGPLAALLYTRILLSKNLRSNLFPVITNWSSRFNAWRRKSQARFKHAVKSILGG